MAKRKGNGPYVLMGTVLTVLFVMSGLIFVSPPQAASSESQILQPSISTQSLTDWHDGTNQSTALLTVTYSENYSTVSQPINNTMTQMDLLQRFMWLQYNDSTGARVGFELHCVFYPGGINITDQKVVNWSKLYNIELILHSESWELNRTVGTMYSFQGFDIVKGNASDVSLSKINEGNGSYFYAVNNTIGSISYWANYAKIGNVVLSIGPGNESIAKFNVLVNATINDGTSSGYQPNLTQEPVSAMFSFTVTHNLTATEYKYGANVDWSSSKYFPTSVPMKKGDHYSLVANDLLMFYVGGTNGEVKKFTTDSGNDTAIYSMNNNTLCKELFTTSYSIDNGTNLLNTTRIYVSDSTHDQFGNVSSVYVVFGGFTYGNSSSLSFDPAVITPNTIKPGGAPLDNGSLLPYVAAIAVIVIGAGIVFRLKKR